MEIARRCPMRITRLLCACDLISISLLIKISLCHLIIPVMIFPIIWISVCISPRFRISLLWLLVISILWTLLRRFVSKRLVLYLMLMSPPLYLLRQATCRKFVVCIRAVLCITRAISIIMKVLLQQLQLLSLLRMWLRQPRELLILFRSSGEPLCYLLALIILVMHLSYFQITLYREVFIWYSSIRVLVRCMLLLINVPLKILMVMAVLRLLQHQGVLI